MPEWLTQAVQHSEHAIDFPTLAIRLALAFVFGCAAAAIHHLTASRPKPGEERTLAATLVLLSLLIAVVTMVIGSNIARAFSLVGALGIIRFRTVVEDTRDTAFVIYAVACGMGAGTGYAAGPALATPLVLLAAWVFRPRSSVEPSRGAGTLVLRLSVGRPPDERLQTILRQHAGESGRLTALTTARGGSAFDAMYAVRLPPAEQVYAMVNELSRVEGVQGVELKED
jgi:uncharacterized membrane protein YhiD involved in acid resistance